MEFLEKQFPCLCYFVMRQRNMKRDLRKYVAKCKAQEDGPIGSYSLYIHGYWLEWLKKERDAGNIVQGKFLTKLKIFD